MKPKRLFGTELLPGYLDELWVKDIQPNSSPLRESNDIADDLVISIQEKGILQPIIVRPKENGFEVIAGNRRLEACKRLRIRKVPCYIIGVDDKQAYEIALIENLQRKSLNPIEEAKAFRRYVDDVGYGAVSELARRIGKSEPYVSKRLALLELPQEMQEEIIRQRINPSIAEELAMLDSSELKEVEKRLDLKNITRSELRNTLKNVRQSIANVEVDPYREEEDALRRIDRARSRCIASMSACLMQMDDAINSLDDSEWFVKENLILFRKSIHQYIDAMIRLRKKSETKKLVRKILMEK
ncbi:MAG: ParB/RepB/Spo0J family partition protein [Nitrososphaerota archaeon]|nr:ParB/RepB/Spo0J family partition protein [Nitrososphaerota archaeon]